MGLYVIAIYPLYGIYQIFHLKGRLIVKAAAIVAAIYAGMTLLTQWKNNNFQFAPFIAPVLIALIGCIGPYILVNVLFRYCDRMFQKYYQLKYKCRPEDYSKKVQEQANNVFQQETAQSQTQSQTYAQQNTQAAHMYTEQEVQNMMHHQKEQYERQFEQEKRKQQNASRGSGDDVDLFAGLKTKEAVKKRYFALMKIYHPDNQDGDKEATEKLQRAYEAKLKTI